MRAASPRSPSLPWLPLLALLALLSLPSWPAAATAAALNPEQALQRIGRDATVCGRVDSVRASADNLVELHMGGAWPLHRLAVELGAPSAFADAVAVGRQLCVTGRLERGVGGRARLRVDDDARIALVD